MSIVFGQIVVGPPGSGNNQINQLMAIAHIFSR